MIEIKRLDNDEIKNKKKRDSYKQKLYQYLKGSGSPFGIYLIFKVNNSGSKRNFDLLKAEYSDLENLKIILIDCDK
jgi:hypothetical protein